MNRFVPGVVAVLLVLSACAASGGTPGASPGASGPPGPSGSEDGEADASDAILVVSYEGGMLRAQDQVTMVPGFVLLADGRVIMPGAEAMIFPGPALHALQVRTLSDSGIAAVLQAIDETELFTDNHEFRAAQAMVADAADTVFHFTHDGRDVRIVVYGLGTLSMPDMGNPPPGVTAADITADRVLSQLMDGLTTIDTSVPPDGWEADGWQPFEPDAFQLYIRDVTGQQVDGGDLPGQVREWPVEDPPGSYGQEVAAFGDGTRCVAVEGDAAASWFTELGQANQQTTWTTDGDDRWQVLPRPILPHEGVACP